MKQRKKGKLRGVMVLRPSSVPSHPQSLVEEGADTIPSAIGCLPVYDKLLIIRKLRHRRGYEQVPRMLQAYAMVTGSRCFAAGPATIL